jgi:hypothetical protein
MLSCLGNFPARSAAQGIYEVCVQGREKSRGEYVDMIPISPPGFIHRQRVGSDYIKGICCGPRNSHFFWSTITRKIGLGEGNHANGKCPKCGALVREARGTKDGVSPNPVFACPGFVAGQCRRSR